MRRGRHGVERVASVVLLGDKTKKPVRPAAVLWLRLEARKLSRVEVPMKYKRDAIPCGPQGLTGP